MPATLSYPGVYVEEIPSGVRTITGVATSITAFIGRAAKGLMDSDLDGPVTITSYADYERKFGGLDPNYPMGYAVRDFYLNGGSQAIIVRLYMGDHAKARSQYAIPKLNLEAYSAGSWGDKLQVTIDANTSPDVAKLYGLVQADLFNLTVLDTVSGAQESFLNLSVKESPRRVDRVLKAGSSLIRVADGFTLPATDVPAPVSKSVVTTVAADNASLDKAAYEGSEANKTGMYALKKVDLFNLLCIPPDVPGGNTDTEVYQKAMTLCAGRRAMLIVDAPSGWSDPTVIDPTSLKLTGSEARNAAVFFPRVYESFPGGQGQIEAFVPCGIIAGVMARTDSQRGVWKAPAGLDASLNGVQGLVTVLTDGDNGLLNPKGVNCLRQFPVSGPVVWGSRTLRGDDQSSDEYKYIPVRRLALYIEESLFRGTQWVVFEPNDEPLWAQIRLNVGAFMHNLFRQGAFQGKTPTDAYFVKCDGETTTQNDINLGIVNIVVGFAPLKPAEFVVIQLQQMAGQIQT